MQFCLIHTEHEEQIPWNKRCGRRQRSSWGWVTMSSLNTGVLNYVVSVLKWHSNISLGDSVAYPLFMARRNAFWRRTSDNVRAQRCWTECSCELRPKWSWIGKGQTLVLILLNFQGKTQCFIKKSWKSKDLLKPWGIILLGASTGIAPPKAQEEDAG